MNSNVPTSGRMVGMALREITLQKTASTFVLAEDDQDGMQRQDLFNNGGLGRPVSFIAAV